ncbi:MAG: hypothetical protein JF610_02035 [Acidobacteria bacterium]|nr:hypothetical protein [Acidobacteriota bacterium]
MTRAAAPIALLLAAMLSLQPATPLDFDRALRDVLTRSLQFTATELAELQRGHAVKHSLEARSPGEFGVAGAIKVSAGKGAFLDAARDIVRFKTGPEILQIGRFSAAPVIEDLAALSVDKADFDPSQCRVGDCNIRLPADVIQRITKEIDLTGRTAQEEAAAWLKQVLLADVQAYVSGGPGRFAEYSDDDRPIRPIDDFAGVLAATPAVGLLVAGLPEHLARFPSAPLPEAEDFLYWSKESFGPAPFISVTHVTIVCPTPRTCVMATKDVYSTRYIDASLAVAVVTDSAAGDAIYVVYANRSRVNALRGMLSALRKSVVERRARGTLEQSLVRIKTRLEKVR